MSTSVVLMDSGPEEAAKFCAPNTVIPFDLLL